VIEATGATLTQHDKELLDFVFAGLEIPEDDAFGIDPGPTPELREYHFDFGNSSYGPVGGCAVVIHYSAADARAMLLEHTPDEVNMGIDSFVARGGQVPHIAYANLYINEEAITIRDIDGVKPYREA
jgi:hypothetical protein